MQPGQPTPHRSQYQIKLTLSTGCEVELDLWDARPGLEHLARALMGEVMYPKLKRELESV